MSYKVKLVLGYFFTQILIVLFIFLLQILLPPDKNQVIEKYHNLPKQIHMAEEEGPVIRNHQIIIIQQIVYHQQY